MKSALRGGAALLVILIFCAFLVGCKSAPKAAVQPSAPVAAKAEAAPPAAAPGPAPAPPESARRELSEEEETAQIMKVYGIEEGAKKGTAEKFYQSGLALYRDLRYAEAARDLRVATRLDPAHEKARKLLYEVLWILGDRKGEIEDVARSLVERREARIKQAEIEMERLYIEARRLFDEKKFDEAIEAFEQVLEIIRWFPYFIDKKGYEDAAKTWIEQARLESQAKKSFETAELKRMAEEQRRTEQAKDYRFVRAKIQTLMEKAMEAFRQEKYAKAEKLLSDVLEVDPTNQEAIKLKAQATKWRHLAESMRNVRDKVEYWRRAFEGVDAAAIPYTDLLRFPTKAEWEVISKRQIPIMRMVEKEESPAVIRIKSKLDNQLVTINFTETAFEEAINFLQEITGLNFMISKSAAEAARDLKVTLRLREIPLRNALSLILGGKSDLRWRIKYDVIYICTEEAEPEEHYLEFYNISEIVQKVPDFPAPEIALRDIREPWGQPGAAAGAGAGIIPIGTEEEAKVGAGIEWPKLEELIGKVLGEEVPDENIKYAGGMLIVRKPLEAHKKIQKLLDTLRKTVGIMVTVEARFVDVQDNLLEQIGVDWRDLEDPMIPNIGRAGYWYTHANGAGETTNEVRGRLENLFSYPGGLSASFPFNITATGGTAIQYNLTHGFQVQAILDAVKKKQEATLLSAPRITVFNTQRSHIMAIFQQSYLADIDINQIGIPTLQPVIGILNFGSILEARPVVSQDKKYVVCEIKPTMAVNWTGEMDREGRDVILQGGNTRVHIHLPSLSLTKLRTTVIVPDGGTVIIGGLKDVRDTQMETTIPIIGHIPVIKNLFRRKGTLNLRRSLIVLLKADITILREQELQLFGTSSW
jgi:general secretion pathway protein D